MRITKHFECADLAVFEQHLQFSRTVTEYLRIATPGWGQLVTHSQKKRMGSHLFEGAIAFCIFCKQSPGKLNFRTAHKIAKWSIISI